MKIRRVVVSFVLVLAMLLSTGCGSLSLLGGDATNEMQETVSKLTDAFANKTNDTDSNVEVKDEALANSETKNADVVMSDDLYDFTFILDGVTYQLPFAYSELVENGWELDWGADSEEDTIAANTYETLYMTKYGASISIDIMNLSGNSQKIKDLMVGGIQTDLDSVADPEFFSIAKGVNLISTIDDIKAAFGPANDTYKGEGYTSLTYYPDEYDYNVSVDFYIDEEDEIWNSIYLTNRIRTTPDKTETSTEVPAYLATYKEPKELGDDLFDPVLELEGDMYHLPAPVQAFTDNGWEILSRPNKVGSGNSESIEIERNGKTLYVDIFNFAEYQTIPENCAVYEISVWKDEDISICIPKGITFDSTIEQVEEVIPKTFDSYDGEGYYYDDYKSGYSLSVQFDDALKGVELIRMSSSEWIHD